MPGFRISNSPQSPNIEQNLDRGISDFGIFGQSLIKENCHNSRTSNDVNMKFGPVTKRDKRNKTPSKKYNVMSESCDVVIIFPIFDGFRAIIQSPDYGSTLCKT